MSGLRGSPLPDWPPPGETEAAMWTTPPTTAPFDLADEWRRDAATPRHRLANRLLAACIVLPLGLAGVAWVGWRDAWQEAEQQVARSAEAVAEYGQRMLDARDAEIRAAQAEWHKARGRDAADTPSADREDSVTLAGTAEPRAGVGGPHAARPDAGPSLPLGPPPTATGNAHRPPGASGRPVSLSVEPARAAQGLARLVPGPADTAGLWQLDGGILAQSQGPAEAPAAASGFLQAIAGTPPRAVFRAIAAQDGEEHLLAVHRIEGWPVYAVVGRPRSAIAAAWRRRTVSQLAIGLPATAALLLLAGAVRHRETAMLAANRGLEADVSLHAAALAENEAMLNGALEAGRVFATDYDAARDLVTVSASAAGILGLPEAAAGWLGGKAFRARIHPDDARHLFRALGALTPEEPDYDVVFRFRGGHGELWLEAIGRAEFSRDRQRARLKGLTRDVTAELTAARAKREIELRLRAATEGAGIGTYEIDLVHARAWFDVQAAASAGLPAETWLPLYGPHRARLDAAIHPDDRAAFEAAWKAVVEGRAAHWSLETRRADPACGWRWDWHHGAAQDPDPVTGRPRRVVGVIRDVTANRRLEAELRQAQKMQALGELAGGIAHDFNNILQAVSGTATLAERDAADPEAVRRRMQALGGAVARGAAITHRLLAFARRDAPKVEPLDPGALLQGAAEILAPALGARIPVAVEAAPGLPALLGDPAQLQTALINLATNARDAMPTGGRLTLSATAEALPAGGGPAALRPGRYIRVSVADTGTGMDEATLARVTEPFFTTKPLGKGTGLGLSMAKSMAEGAGGGLSIDSAPGRGTTVSLWLPEAEAGRAAIAGPFRALGADPRTGTRLLLVEDDPLLRETMAEQLRERGIEVIEAGDAAAALVLLAEADAVDALVTDLGMPGLDGVALIAAARRQRPGLPAVLLTGETGSDETLLRGCQAGGPASLLHKPAACEALVAQIDGLLPSAA
ncbi:ATP-binding protein [Falsiroseomonas sp. HW251]|uniref:ATP-binding protein n=1 Tax=Falsiroseomonas sp. HW251 TaxID=3390998 RepID=UPI003D3194F2